MFQKKNMYFFKRLQSINLFRERGREEEREGEKTATGCLARTPNQGPGPPAIQARALAGN